MGDLLSMKSYVCCWLATRFRNSGLRKGGRTAAGEQYLFFISAPRTGSGTRGGAGPGTCSQPAGHVVQGGTQALHMFHQLQAETQITTIVKFSLFPRTPIGTYSIHCLKSNPNFRDITWNVVDNMILHELFRVVSRFPATFHVISRKKDFLWDGVSPVNFCKIWQFGIVLIRLI